MTSELERLMQKAQLALRHAQDSAQEAMTASHQAAKASAAAGRAVEALLAKALPAFHRDRAGVEPLTAAVEAVSNAARMDRRETGSTDPDPRPFDWAEAAGIAVGVKASRNVGQTKKAILTGAGLEWIGRDQWRGVTGPAGLAALQATFGEVRVTRLIARDPPSQESPVTAGPRVKRGDPSPAGANPSTADEEVGPPGVSPPDGRAKRERTRLPLPFAAAPYPGQPLGFSARRSLEDIDDAQLAGAIAAAVAVESVTDLDGIVERLRVPWRLKANGRFRDIIKAGLPLGADRLLATTGWEPGQDRVWYGARDADVTVWDRGEAHSEARRWKRLPPPEVALAATRCLGHLGPTQQADLVVTVTRVLGYESTSKSLNDVVVGALDRLCSEGIVRREDGLITLDAQPATRITPGGWWAPLERAHDGRTGED